MKKTKISIVVTSLLLLVALCFSMASCGLKPDDGENSKVNEENNAESLEVSSFKTEFVNTAHVVLMAASEPMMAANGETSHSSSFLISMPNRFSWRIRSCPTRLQMQSRIGSSKNM